VCNNRPAECISPENGWLSILLFKKPIHVFLIKKKRKKIRKVEGRDDCTEGLAWAGLEQSLVQILVVVARIQTKEEMKAEEGKGSKKTEEGLGLVDPKH